MDFDLTPETALYVVGLTFIAGAIVGVLPALKATGGRVQSRLQGLSAGSGSRVQMGRLWTILIVAQVAFTVALLPATIYHAYNALKFRTGNPGYAAEEIITAELALDGVAPVETGCREDRGVRLAISCAARGTRTTAGE